MRRIRILQLECHEGQLGARCVVLSAQRQGTGGRGEAQRPPGKVDRVVGGDLRRQAPHLAWGLIRPAAGRQCGSRLRLRLVN